MTKTTATKEMLANGVRVILLPRPEAVATNVLVLVETGSKYEEVDEGGLSHFIEHMCFKGTKKYRGPGDVSIAFDRLGAHFNAFTSQEYTGYYATVAPRQSLAALELLAEMYLRPSFPAAELGKERGVIVEEINMYEDQPHRLVGDILLNVVYGDTPAGRPIIGTKESLASFNRDTLAQHHARHYVAAATIVVVAGNFNERAMRRAIERQFGRLKSGVAKPAKLAVAETQTSPAQRLRLKMADQSHLAIGWRALPAGAKRRPAAELLAAVLGGGMSSRLFRRIRDELGAAYYVRANHDAYTDHGLLEIAVGADRTRVVEIVRVIIEECRRLRDELVPKAELERVKESLTSQFYLGLETVAGLGAFYGLNEVLTGHWETPTTTVRQIKAVTARELKALAAEIFTEANLNLALIGPATDESQLAAALRL